MINKIYRLPLYWESALLLRKEEGFSASSQKKIEGVAGFPLREFHD